MSTPAVPPAADQTPREFPLPRATVAALDAGRPIVFRHPRTGAAFRLAPGPTSSEAESGFYSPTQIAAMNGPRSLAEELAAETATEEELVSWDDFRAEMAAEFPALRDG